VAQVDLTLNSKDGDQGFPGNLTVRVRYTVWPCALRIEYLFTTDQTTIVNRTNHSSFNRSGHPGRSILGDDLAHAADRYTPIEKSRAMGLGIVVEYEGQKGQPEWKDPIPVEWDYTQFGNARKAPEPDETFVLTFRDVGALNGSQYDTWTINNRSWPDIPPLNVQKGKRYRLVFRNGSGDQHPMHLHRHTFEVTRVGKTEMSGLFKDVVNVMPLDSVAVDFVADNPGHTLMHCHQQLHMDFGFMQLIRYTS
jgi:hypothetical protein